jgi:hypothetical protein
VALTAVLSEIDDWLARHAPATAAMLHPPATPSQVEALEASLGPALLPEVATVLRWHNGTVEDIGGFELAPTYWLFDAGTVARDALRLNANAAQFDQDGWDDRWVPLAADRCGGYLLVNHEQGADRGKVDLWDPENGPPSAIWSGLEELCSELRTALVHRQPLMNCVYEIVDGAVAWTDEELADAPSG